MAMAFCINHIILMATVTSKNVKLQPRIFLSTLTGLLGRLYKKDVFVQLSQMFAET